MKESLLCSVLVFLADTPKSAGGKKGFKAQQKLMSAPAMAPFISHMGKILPYSCIMVHPAST